jgi:hypothetical protein
MSDLPRNLGITVSLLSFRGGIPGDLRGGLTGIARQLGRLALGNARITGDTDGVPGGLPFGECRVVRPGFRAKPLQFRLLRFRCSVGRQNLSH